MEANTCYLGIELNDSYAMVSYMQPNMEEPETVSTIAGSENYRIPTLLARRKNVGMWYYGEDAGRMAKTSEVICVDSLLRRAAASEVITIAKESYDAVDLLGYVVFRSTRKQKVEEPEPELSVDALLAATSDNDDENLEDIGYSEKSETRKLIEKFVDENPDAAALLLRNWLNDDWE